ncbi:mitochondrial ribonuclease P catalytic subunit [Acyrthosiphon pisum]|uniref:PRORP domain-containing protein n=1 Tax=Acyrthosiphon pisum TaxID=7029 RepID=A0A8R2A7L9_ACYPI|nr:mitochondrial ribonuclease P catalytic subunit [Acyrthosiphon pisum]|eukprot:XP_001949258.2 PREDICTED: mitochondrial ribonuclease P protein 3 [Acyrthosiphon pisum]
MCSLLRKHLHWNLLKLVCPRHTIIYTQRLLSVVTPDIIVPRKMKGRFASEEQKRIITELVIKSSSSIIDWDALKSSVLSINRGYINEKNINGCILEACSQQKRLDLVKSFMKYVKQCSHGKPNIALELLYIRSCYKSRSELTDNDQYEIQTNCQSLFKNNLHLLNSVLLEGIVMGICCTPLWRDSLKFIKESKVEDNISLNTFVSVILRAFEEEEIDLGWTTVQNMFNLHRIIPLEIVAAWFNVCEKNVNCSHRRVLEFLRDNEYIIRENLAELIRSKLNQSGIKTTTTMIYHNNGKCKNCNQVLEHAEVTNSDFKILQERFLSDVMIGKNIFNNSSPQELSDFKDFIEITAPYDVVVDGLNLAYAYRGKIGDHSLTKFVMKSFIEKKLKVLLIGRKHLVKMLGKEFDFIKKNAHIFFTNDLSKDDPFVLYAAMYSGIDTKILTRDLMRGHKYLLGDAIIKSIFQKWLQKHRLGLRIRPGNEVIIKEPITYLQATQESANGIWHMPYQEFKEPGSWSKPDSSPDKWMCIQM